MNHEDFREWLQLLIADELTHEQDNLMREHLAGCDECRAEYAELQRLLSHLGESGAREPSERLLWEARQDLFGTIRKDSLTESIMTRLTQGVAPSVSGSRGGPHSTYSPGFGLMGWFRGFRLALSGAAAIAVGIFIGYLAFGRDVTPQAVSSFDGGSIEGELGGPDIANVRFVDWNSRDGQIELQYDLIRPVRLRSTVEDDRVQRVLAHALLNEDNPGVRLQAIDALDARGATREHGEDVKLALISSLKSDPNAGVRREALRVLQDLAFDDEIKEACLYILANDENPGMRVASINLLSGARLAGYPVGRDVYDFVNQTLETKDDPMLRARSTAFIEEVQDE